MNSRELETRILDAIPLARAMNVRVREVNADGVTLKAPLEPSNLNHERTAFGGSLHAVAVLAGWALVTDALAGEAVGYLVIQESHIAYRRPVTADFEARARWTSGRLKFFEGLRRKGLARAKVEVDIVCANESCASLRASFVAEVEVK